MWDSARTATSSSGETSRSAAHRRTPRWVIDQPGVGAVIPGARNAAQARGEAADMSSLAPEAVAVVRRFCDERTRPHVRDRR